MHLAVLQFACAVRVLKVYFDSVKTKDIIFFQQRERKDLLKIFQY